LNRIQSVCWVFSTNPFKHIIALDQEQSSHFHQEINYHNRGLHSCITTGSNIEPFGFGLVLLKVFLWKSRSLRKLHPLMKQLCIFCLLWHQKLICLICFWPDISKGQVVTVATNHWPCITALEVYLQVYYTIWQLESHYIWLYLGTTYVHVILLLPCFPNSLA